MHNIINEKRLISWKEKKERKRREKKERKRREKKEGRERRKKKNEDLHRREKSSGFLIASYRSMDKETKTYVDEYVTRTCRNLIPRHT